jgi:tetratricopeptide (TPR) repeat protein
MGYGVKTDYTTGRELDLDKTYRNIIRPAVEAAGLACIRADEVRHSGVIDVPMYEYLINADVVIADLSTYNTNAFYELGVRHALRPFTTIAISEKDMKQPFDINHTVIRRYEHLGKDIGFDEVMRFREELLTAIREILTDPRTDSPVYTYLPGLKPPFWKAKSTSQQSVPSKETLSTIVEKAKTALDAEKFEEAIPLLNLAHELDPANSYIIHKLSLATYKSKKPTHVDALEKALNILVQLDLNTSTDPETLGLAGAIHKRLWEELKDQADLSASIAFYEKGYRIKNDYYNGINLAYLLNVRACETGDRDDAIADKVFAKRVRQQVVEICEELQRSNFEDRGDRYWILATLEEAHFGLGNTERYLEAKDKAEAVSKAKWERDSTEEQIAKLGALVALR